MRHPIKTNRIQSALAKTGWVSIVLVFVLVTYTISFLLALYQSFLTSNPEILSILRESFAVFLALTDVVDSPQGYSRGSLAILGLSKLAVPALALGAAVFKISLPSNVYVPSKKIFVHEKDDGSAELIFRSYNATALPAVSLSFEAIIRLSKINQKGNRIDNVYIEPQEPSQKPPVMLPYVPHSVRFPLEDGDIKTNEDGSKTLASIQGKPCLSIQDGTTKRPGDTYLLIIISGWLPELGSQFVEMESFRLTGKNPEYHFGDYAGIDVLPPKGRLDRHEGRPKRWKGWRDFDKVRVK